MRTATWPASAGWRPLALPLGCERRHSNAERSRAQCTLNHSMDCARGLHPNRRLPQGLLRVGICAGEEDPQVPAPTRGGRLRQPGHAAGLTLDPMTLSPCCPTVVGAHVGSVQAARGLAPCGSSCALNPSDSYDQTQTLASFMH